MVCPVSDASQTMNAGDLARLRSRIAGCELVVLADISTKTVLAWDGALRLPQEHLDTLCDLAAEILAVDPAAAQVQPDTALLTRTTGSRTFVRSPEDPAEVLCCVLAIGAEPQQALDVCISFFEPGGRGNSATVH